MKNKLIVGLTVSLFCGVVIAQSIIRPTSDGDNLGVAGKTFGTAFITSIASNLTFLANITLTHASSDAVITATGFEAKEARLVLTADQDDDAGDMCALNVADGSAGMTYQTDVSVKGTLATKITFDTAGKITTADDIAVNGDDITSDGDLTITPAGTEMFIDGGLSVGDTTAVGDNNAKIVGTLTQVGVATFTAESVHNAGIDADGITVDAGDGIDTKTAGTLLVGDATANKIEVGLTAVETEVQGTLDVIEAASFDAAVTFDVHYIMTEIAAPSTPATNTCVIYLDTADGDLKAIDDNGETVVIANFTSD